MGEIDGDCIVLPRGGQRRRLARLADECLEMRPREGTEIEPPEYGVAELDEAQREPVATRLRHMLHEPGRGQRREETRHRARVDTGSPRDLVGAELSAVCKRIDHEERPLDGGDVTDGWLAGTGRDTLHSDYLTHHCPGGN